MPGKAMFPQVMVGDPVALKVSKPLTGVPIVSAGGSEKE
jgi:hypothetical protein